MITVSHREQCVEQTRLHQIGITISNGLIDAMAIGNGTVTGTGDLTGVVETNHNGDRQVPGDVQTLEDLDADIKVGSTLLDGVEVGEVGEIA